MDKAAKKADRSTNSGVVEAYSHEGRIGVLVEVLCETDFVARNEEFKQLAHDLALQVAAMSPKYVSPDSVPAEVVEEQRNRASEQARSEGKPEAVIEKIANGKLEKYYSEVCLLNQAFIKDQDKTVGELVNEKVAKIGERIQVARFVRFELGESSDKSI
ncbi:MAG: Elongation factor Ts [bacterium ADurb.Bin400]|nr:MAG: Elongation factor Ts [bacterium ADurb.Bin400]